MADTKTGIRAGDLHQRVAFEQRGSGNDGAGGVGGAWAEQFCRWAGYTHLRGGETVMAARLEGRHQVVIRVRACRKTLHVTTDWRLRDTRTGTIYAVRDITPIPQAGYVDLLCESGVAP